MHGRIDTDADVAAAIVDITLHADHRGWFLDQGHTQEVHSSLIGEVL
jgi:hypothetical protein